VESFGVSFEDLASNEELTHVTEEKQILGDEHVSAVVDASERPHEEESLSEAGEFESTAVTEPEIVPAAATWEKTGEEEEKTHLSVEAFFKEEMERESRGRTDEERTPALKHKKFEDLLRGRIPARGTLRRQSSFRAILLIVLLLLAGLGGFFWWQSQGRSSASLTVIGTALEGVVEKLSGLWEEVIGFRDEDLELSALQGYEDVIGQHQVYVIRGEVTNKSKRIRKHVKLRIVILDQSGKKLKEKTIFCGNVFSREELENLSSRFFIREDTLQPKRPMDMVVKPNETISFMALFSGLPREGKSFKVEKLEAPGV
jgi:hypothetical protein